MIKVGFMLRKFLILVVVTAVFWLAVTVLLKEQRQSSRAILSSGHGFAGPGSGFCI